MYLTRLSVCPEKFEDNLRSYMKMGVPSVSVNSFLKVSLIEVIRENFDIFGTLFKNDLIIVLPDWFLLFESSFTSTKL